MKRINLYILSLFIIGLLQSGCQDFLSVEPVGNVNTEEFYKTLNDLQLGLNATYNVLGTDRYQKSEWLFGEGCGDDAIRTVSMSPSGDEGRLVQFTFTPRNQWIFNRWQINYEGIFRANWVISKAADLPLDQINIFDEQDFLPIIVGQAKFLRALFYFNLVKTYGGVPIKPERIFINGSQDNTIQPRSSIEEVYDYIERDLREALLMVDDRYNTDFFQRGKADKGAVAALLLKVLAYQAEPGVLHPKWQQAMEFGDYLVNQRRLSNREVLNFNVKYDNEFNPETWPELKQRLFLNLNEDLTEEEQLNLNVENTQLYTINFPYEFLWIDEGEFQPGSIFELVHTEISETSYNVGTRWDQELGRANTTGKLQPNNFWRDQAATDPRAAFIFAQGSDESIEYACGREGTISGGLLDPVKSFCMKWFHPSCQRSTSGDANSGRNFRIIRFAEVKLFYAEALNELGLRADAVQQIKDLLERANTIDDRFRDGRTRNVAAITVDSYENTRDLIWAERRLELGFEFDRFWDIVRQRRATTFMQIFNSNAAAFGPLWRKDFKTGINEIFPIPQDEIDLSNGVISQNPGY